MSSLKKNYVYSLISQMLIILTPIIVTPYISRVLGPDNVGIYNYAFSIVNYFILFGCVGLNLYGQREIAYVKDDKEATSKLFYELQIIRTVTITLAIATYLLTTVRVSQYPLYYLLLGIEILASLFDITWFFQGLENFKMPALRNIVIKGLFLLCVFVFVKEETHLWIYIICYALSLVIGNLSLWFSLKGELVKVPVLALRPLSHMSPVLILFFPQVATNVYTQLDKTMTGLLTDHNYAEVSYYSQAESIIKIAMTIITSVGGVMLSRVAAVFSKDDTAAVKDYIEKSFRFMFLLAWPMVFGFVAVASDFVPWFFGPGYDKVVPCMIALAPLVLIIGISNILGTQYLLPTNQTKLYTISVLSGMCVNVILNFIFIPKFLSIGAVIATLIAECAVTLTQFVFVRKTFSLKILLFGWKNFIAALLMGIATFALSNLLPSTIWATAVEVLLGVILYALTLFALRDNFVKSILRRG